MKVQHLFLLIRNVIHGIWIRLLWKPTEPKPTEPEPTQPSTGGIKVEDPGTGVSFAEYEAMSGQEQMLFYYTFADANAFNTWYDEAKAAHDAGKNDIIIGKDGVVNLG